MKDKCCGCIGSKCGCYPEDVCSDVCELTYDSLKKKYDAEEDFVIINVLEPEYYNDCRIAGSINIPLAKLEEGIKKYPKDQPIIVYCASFACPASKKAYEKLKALGYKYVHAYEGGIKEWKQKGGPCEGPCTKF